MKSSRFVASIIFTTATVVGLSSVAFAEEGPSVGWVPPSPPSNSKPKYIVPYVRSDSYPTWTETVITLHNMGKHACEAHIRYYNRDSNDPRGYSEGLLEPGESKEFVTYNHGEVVEPYVANAYRKGGWDFEGYAIIYTDCNTEYFTYNATLVIDIDPTIYVGGHYTSLKVKKYKTGHGSGGPYGPGGEG